MFLKSGLLLICLVASLISIAIAKEDIARIVNGHVIRIDRASYMVQLRLIRRNGFFLCGGTLVTSQYVITAAHCFDDFDADDVLVVGGASTITDTGVQRKIHHLYRPIDYREGQRFHMDIAILKLEQPMTGTYIKPLPLCSKPWKYGELLQVSGWGRTSRNATKASTQLRTVSLPILNHLECLQNQGPELTSAMECTYSPDQDFCLGDSGGPGVLDGELCGVVSWNRGCANNEYTGVFTNVYAARDFVDSIIKK